MFAFVFNGGRHVLDAHLTGPGRRLLLGLLRLLLVAATHRIATQWARAGGVEATLLRLVHLLPHKAAEHRPQHLGQHVPYK